jgi:tetratricopeptide (TPR) repeat protein
MNRRIRTRMYGGVGGRRPRGLPLSRLVGIISLVFSLRLFVKGKHRGALALIAISLAFLFICIPYVNSGYSDYKANKEEARFAQARKEEIEKKRHEEEKFNQEHKEDHYQQGLALLKEKKYSEAKELLVKVSSVDMEYKDVREKIVEIKNAIQRGKKEKEKADARAWINEAGKLLNSNNCYEIQQAIEKSRNALKVFPDSKTAQDYLLKAQVKKLACFEGNSQVQMAIHIVRYRPLQLSVSIRNDTSSSRHTNPGYFTLVTVSGRSLSVSSETYGLTGYFDAVELQPDTKSSGYLIFDTSEKPQLLVYEDFQTRITRAFPFK